jgi:hypothetical protein
MRGITKPMLDHYSKRLIEERYKAIKPFLVNEQLKRVFAASEAKAIGYGGVTILHEITGLNRQTIKRGLEEIENADDLDLTRIRKEGGGRKRIEEVHEGIKERLEEILNSSTCGDPQSALKWCKKSLHNLADELTKEGYPVSHMTVHSMLNEMGYSMQGNRKAIEGNSQHPDRNDQFLIISQKVNEFQDKELPVISVDTKKKELVGNYMNGGREYCPKGKPTEVNGHDFEDKKKGSVRPYGVYDITNKQGWVNVGTDKDTAEFAAESIRRWWYKIGSVNYPDSKAMLITADGGGSNSSRTRLWKYELQKLVDEINVEISVCHYPPGTSKWNKIEHQMFSHISQNWRGRPLISHEVIINLIGSTTTKKGLKIECELDENKYETGIKITDEQMDSINIVRDEILGNWNYTIKPSAGK